MNEFNNLIRDVNIPLQNTNILGSNYVFESKMVFYDGSQIKEDSLIVKYIKKHNLSFSYENIHKDNKIILICQSDQTANIYKSTSYYNVCSIVGLVNSKYNPHEDSELLYRYGSENIKVIFQSLNSERPYMTFKALNEINFKMYYHPYFSGQPECFRKQLGPEMGVFGERVFDNTMVFRYSMKQYVFEDNNLSESKDEKYLLVNF